MAASAMAVFCEVGEDIMRSHRLAAMAALAMSFALAAQAQTPLATTRAADGPAVVVTTATGIANGEGRKIAKGDIVVVPEGVAHMLTPDAGGPLVIAAVYMPRTGPGPAAAAAASPNCPPMPANSPP